MTTVDPVSSLGGDQPEHKKNRFTDREKRDELAREVNLRKVVYPGQVRAGRLTHAQAERQRDIMQEIWEEFRDRCIAVDKKNRPELPFMDTDVQLQGDTTKLIDVDPGAGDDQSNGHRQLITEDDLELQSETEAREGVREAPPEPPPTEQPVDQAASQESGAKPASE